MNGINYFSKLDRNDLNYILKEAGDFSNVSKVCKLFNEVAAKEAESTHAYFAALFGAPCLARVIKNIGLSSRPCSAKVDGLFFAARQGNARTCMNYNQDHSEALKTYMRPWLEADATFKLWRFLFEKGDPGLKELMSKLQLSPENDYLKNVRLIRAFFEANSAELRAITTLNLFCIELRVLPLEICHYLTSLEALDLSDNFLWELPKEIVNLSGLTDLRLNRNFLASLPNEIGELHFLKNLQCSFNLLREVPVEICNLKELRMLNFSRNQLRIFPKMENFQALNYFYAESNRLNSLPSSIGALPNLIGLYLHDNRIERLPDSFCKLTELKYLSVSGNRLTSLPDNIGRMTSLRSLCINDNQIRNLPHSFTSLARLNQLFLYGNQLTDFPEGMDKLKKLKLFCFQNNPIETFPLSMRSLHFWSKYPQFYPYLEDGRLQKVLNKSMTIPAFYRAYWNLGEDKWKECIDGVHHPFGKDVYDKGLHGKKVEPGFLKSMEKSFDYLTSNYNHIIDADFYLKLHSVACQHFNGTETSTLMGLEKVGKFRDFDDRIVANFKAPDYAMSECAINEFQTLDALISLLFGSSFRLGDLVVKSQRRQSIDIQYFAMSKEQVRLIFNFFLTEFYYDIGHAKDKHSQVRAIAKLIQRLEWLHPVRDGCGRTDTALLNFLLTCYGFTPVLLKFPYVSSSMSLDDWTQAVKKGIEDWRTEDAGESA